MKKFKAPLGASYVILEGRVSSVPTRYVDMHGGLSPDPFQAGLFGHLEAYRLSALASACNPLYKPRVTATFDVADDADPQRN